MTREKKRNLQRGSPTILKLLREDDAEIRRRHIRGEFIQYQLISKSGLERHRELLFSGLEKQKHNSKGERIMTREELREKLAEQAHKSWAGWAKWMLNRLMENPCEIDSLAESCPLIGKWPKRWDRQAETDYADLSEKEKDSDRKEADEYLAILDQFLKSQP